jgi:parvulin-like peptidyl-prolyl isomerase
MVTTLQPPNLLDRLRQRSIEAIDLLPLLVNYRLMPQLLSENILDQAIEGIECDPTETAQACAAFYQQKGLASEAAREAWRSHYGFTGQQVEAMATRHLRLEKFVESSWGSKLKSYFLEQKHKLDQVIYSLVRVDDRNVANELYFRIVEGEQSFAQLARLYSQGEEAETDGRLGPFAFGTLHPELARLLYLAPIGLVQPPVMLGQWASITRVEQRIPAQLDDTMRRYLLQEQFDRWLREQLSQLPEADQVWLEIASDPSDLDAKNP